VFQTISIIGLGYIGLPTAALFASRKKTVIGIDINKYVVDTVNQGKIHIVEPALEGLVQAAVTSGYLRATTTPEPADVFLIAVPTPFSAGYKPDLSYIKAAAQSIAPVLKPGNIVILESTSPVGTTEQLCEWLAGARCDLRFPQTAGEAADVHIAYCPERVLPGKAIHELVENDRIIGGTTRKATSMAAEIYSIFVKGELVATNSRTAEMCKLVENSFRDVNIAFANEISIICDELHIDVWELIALANRHPRVKILQPSVGVGGHCIAVDPWFIVATSPKQARLIRMAREVNDYKPRWVTAKIQSAIDELITGGSIVSSADIKIACLGLAFKADIDDLRQSPAIQIAKSMALLGYKILLAEPNIDDCPSELALTNVSFVDVKTAINSADILCVFVKHQKFLAFGDEIKSHARVLDMVGILE
jgi:UDP-N-acetyl-D-mannosaminuronic acid dehydrogenase